MKGHRQFIIHLVLLISFVVMCLIEKNVFSQQGTLSNNDSEMRGSKQLNNVLSVAIGNGRNGALFKIVDLPNSVLSKPIPSFCSRKLYDVDLKEPSSFEGALARVYKSRTLRIGVYMGDPLLYSVDDKGVASGYLVDVSWIVTSQMGLILGRKITPMFIPYTFTNYLKDTTDLINSEKIDTAHVFYLASRSLSVDFTCFYRDAFGLAAYADSVIGLPASVGTPSSILDLNQPYIRISIITGTISEDAADRFLPLAQKKFFTSRDNAFNAVGRTTDIVFYDENSVALYNSQNDNRLVKVKNTQTFFVGGVGLITKRFKGS